MTDNQVMKMFTWFMEQVREACCNRDLDKSKALLAEVFKLLGNSGYWKLIKPLEWQTNVIYTKDAKDVDSVAKGILRRSGRAQASL